MQKLRLAIEGIKSVRLAGFEALSSFPQVKYARLLISLISQANRYKIMQQTP